MPSIGVYGLTGCGGDQLTILNCEEKIVDMYDIAEVQSFVMAQSDNDSGKVDIALVEGSVSTEEQKEHLLKIREESEIVVAIGNCSCYGGPQAMDIGRENWEDNYKQVYGDIEMEHTDPIESRPIGSFIEVDMLIPGCPIDRGEFMSVFSKLVKGIPVEEYPLPVCAECKWRQNACLLNEGKMCIGPLTQGGCDAVCPTHNLVCVGCRGPVVNGNVASEIDMLQEMGFTKEEFITRMRLYGGKGAADEVRDVLAGGDGDE